MTQGPDQKQGSNSKTKTRMRENGPTHRVIEGAGTPRERGDTGVDCGCARGRECRGVICGASVLGTFIGPND